MTSGVERRLRRAAACHRAGKLAAAERMCGEVLERDPDNPESWHLLGCLAQQRGDGKAAAARVLQAIRKRPDNPAYHSTLGDILAAQGKAREAALCYREALRLDPACLAALVNLGNALQHQGRYREACVSYWRAIQQQPECAEAYNNLGNALRGDGRPDESLACYGEVLRMRPGNAEAAANMAGALAQLNRHAEAEPWARRAVELLPESVAALSNLSVVLIALRRYQEAEGLARQALVRDPLAPHLYFNLGSALLHQKRFAEAESLLRGALAVRPDSPEVRTALGAALSGQDRLEEAEAECRQVITAQPESVEGWTELGLICADLGRTTDALACLDVAVRLRPEYAKAHFARSISLLREGRMAEGFAEYEWRWPMLAERPRACARPAWDGGPLNGKTILLSAEQGLGDAIQFVRYAPLVAARGGRVVVEVPEKLGPLVRTAAGVADVVTPAMPLPPFDEQAPLMSLPRIFGATLETIPAAIPYLRADERLTEEMRVGLGRAQGPRIGLAWAGNPDHLANRRRSLTLEALAPLERLPGIEWYSLHAGDRACAQARASGWLRAVLSDSGGVAELAALMSCLDLVISVDSMPAHLAGALGRPVWTLLCLAADWRWLREREDAPWYPGMRLFRQTRRGDWEGVVARVCREIAKGAVQGFDHRTDKHS